jgi:hypothetical protein
MVFRGTAEKVTVRPEKISRRAAMLSNPRFPRRVGVCSLQSAAQPGVTSSPDSDCDELSIVVFLFQPVSHPPTDPTSTETPGHSCCWIPVVERWSHRTVGQNLCDRL